MNRTCYYIKKLTPHNVESILNSKHLVIDLETTGLNPRKDRIVGMSFAIEPNSGCYTTDIKGLMSVVYNYKGQLVFHNAVFDLSMLKAAGYALRQTAHDTMLLAHLLNPDRPHLGLKDLAVELLGEGSNRAALKMYQWLQDNSLTKEDISKAPIEVLAPYAAEDAINTYEIFVALAQKAGKLNEYFKKQNIKFNIWNQYLREVVDLIPVVVDMQLNGVKLDLEATALKQKELELRSAQLCQELTVINQKEIAQVEEILHVRKIEDRKKKNKSGKIKVLPARSQFNWDSNNNLKQLFLGVHKLQITKKTAKGNASVDSSFLETIKDKFEWIPKLLEYKELKKLTSTYLGSLLERQEGGFIHASFNVSGTTTGRFSSSNPNLQNLPKHGGIKSLFIPRKGHSFIYADYSQLELRIAAHLSKDKRLIEAYRLGTDLHQQTTDFIGISERDKGKRINFAIIYNASGWRVAEILGLMDGIPVCPKTERDWKCDCVGCVKRKKAAKKGDEIIEVLFGKYQGIKNYVDKQREFMIRYGVVISEFSRIRRLEGLKSQVKREYTHALKAGFNFPIQSFGASLCKRSMVALYKAGYRLVNQVHDSVMIEIPNDRRESAIVEIKDIMENIYKISVPLIVEPKILTSFEEK
jgi:DNA polymerase-1